MRNILAKQTRYSSPAIFFHWAVFLLVALAYLAIEIRGPKGSDSRVFWMNVHLTAGTLVLVLSVLRVLWRAVSRVPQAIPQAALLRWLSKLAHFALYLFILAQPLLGCGEQRLLLEQHALGRRRRAEHRREQLAVAAADVHDPRVRREVPHRGDRGPVERGEA